MGQDAVQKGYHCAYQLHYHIVFPVKYRKALLSEAITQAIKEIALGIQERYAIEIERIGCDRDHIHLLCSAHPKYAPGQLVRVFKSITARGISASPNPFCWFFKLDIVVPGIHGELIVAICISGCGFYQYVILGIQLDFYSF